MSELRALIRLCGVGDDPERAARRAELAAVLAEFSEGHATADVAEAREALAGG
jgi:hypothetical protein